MKKSTLKNGLEIYTEQVDSAKTVTFSVYAKVGSYNEKENFGISHFIEHMVFKGTNTRNSQDIMEEIENVGGYVNAETSFEHTRYFATVPAEEWKTAADVITDIVFNSTFPEEEVDLERTVIQEELKMYSDDSSSHVTDMLLIAMHKSYPERQTIGGTIQTVADITREDLVNFKNKFYQPNNLFIVATGKVNHDDIVEFMKQFENIEQTSEIEKEEQFEPDILSSDTESLSRNIEQSHFTWGLFGPSSNDHDIFAVEVAAAILGGSSSSRLYQLIREKRGLAYTVSVFTFEMKQNSIICGYTGLDASRIEEVKEIVVEEFERLRNELVSDSELNRVIAYLRGKHIIGLEKPSSINGYIGSSIIKNLSTNPDDYIKGLESVTKEDIKKVARKYFTPDNWQFAEITPKNQEVN
ncbi:gp2 [Bacillus phage G]|uniref:Gp2 n=1 Tax=Bacillus phage G TaxID=2884420 RepID=G3MBJ8_9CAUD|nr:gp2 [Bacillus phage G]AEO93273.1 gp2 [Bacillus phage G]